MSDATPAAQIRRATRRRRPLNLLLAEVARPPALAEAGVGSPRADAEELAALGARRRRGELHTGRRPRLRRPLLGGVARREDREPLQHITGARLLPLPGARGRAGGVRARGRRPRSMVGWAIDRLRAWTSPSRSSSTCAPAPARSRWPSRRRCRAPGCTPWSCPRTPTPGPRATSSGGGRGRVLHLADARDRAAGAGRPVDLVVSNPPYIPLTEWEYVAPEARDYDPRAGAVLRRRTAWT